MSTTAHLSFLSSIWPWNKVIQLARKGCFLGDWEMWMNCYWSQFLEHLGAQMVLTTLPVSVHLIFTAIPWATPIATPIIHVMKLSLKQIYISCLVSQQEVVNLNFFKDFIYSFMRDREREKEAETQAEGEAGSLQGGWCGTWSRILGSGPELKADTQLLSQPGVPLVDFLRRAHGHSFLWFLAYLNFFGNLDT